VHTMNSREWGTIMAACLEMTWCRWESETICYEMTLMGMVHELNIIVQISKSEGKVIAWIECDNCQNTSYQPDL